MRMQAYEVRLIPSDLRREEAILQIADSLDYMQKLTDSIFKKIQNRVADCNKRLQSVCDRADIAQKKIDKIRGSSKATKVFSSCKYPGDENLDYYKALFMDNDGLTGKQISSYHVKSKHITPDEKILKNKLQFYNVKVPQRQKGRDQLMEEGLGSLPKQLDSLSTLLLFNTSENPYKKYVILDPLGAVTKTKKSLADEETDEIGAAPISISQRETIGAVEKMNYFYNPGLGQVPEMDVPLALPDLPGIADDMLYSAESEPSIAPSSIPIISSTVLPELPTILPEISPDTPTVETSPNTAYSNQSLPTSQPSTTTAPPPAQVPETTHESQDQADKGAVKSPPVPAPGDARANLLDSIRKAGGSGKAKLKSAKDRKVEAKKKKEEEKAATVAPGGDLMSDLFNKLQMRRKGISGANRTGSVSEGNPQPPAIDPGSTLQKISLMIPPPPLKKPPEPKSGDDEDDDDWD